jgi:hypothetical protein
MEERIAACWWHSILMMVLRLRVNNLVYRATTDERRRFIARPATILTADRSPTACLGAVCAVCVKGRIRNFAAGRTQHVEYGA